MSAAALSNSELQCSSNALLLALISPNGMCFAKPKHKYKQNWKKLLDEIILKNTFAPPRKRLRTLYVGYVLSTNKVTNTTNFYN